MLATHLLVCHQLVAIWSIPLLHILACFLSFSSTPSEFLTLDVWSLLPSLPCFDRLCHHAHFLSSSLTCPCCDHLHFLGHLLSAIVALAIFSYGQVFGHVGHVLIALITVLGIV
jgi:hypothetical protein